MSTLRRFISLHAGDAGCVNGLSLGFTVSFLYLCIGCALCTSFLRSSAIASFSSSSRWTSRSFAISSTICFTSFFSAAMSSQRTARRFVFNANSLTSVKAFDDLCGSNAAASATLLGCALNTVFFRPSSSSVFTCWGGIRGRKENFNVADFNVCKKLRYV